MYFKELSDQQSRLQIDITQLFDAYGELQRQRAETNYTLVWKRLRGKQYLFKKIDARGNGRIVGPRNRETQAAQEAFRHRRAELRGRDAGLRTRLAEQARLAKALGLGRVPRVTAAVLRVLNRSGLLGRNVIVVGTNALYAYEAAAGVRLDSAVMETADIDILWEAGARLTLAADIAGAGLIGVLRQANRSFAPARARGFRAINRDGFMVDLLKALPKNLIADDSRRAIGDDNDLFAAETRNLAWLLSARKFRQTALGTDGFPVPFVVPDPRLFALHKLWLSAQPEREPVKKGRDLAQAEAVLQLLAERLPQYPLDPKVLKGLPGSARVPRLPDHL